jgi:hypothetical protein
MSLSSFSHELEQTTRPHGPYYHFVQVTLFAGLSYIGTACWTKIRPIRGTILVVLAYGISQLITPLFVNFFEAYQDVSLVPLVGQVLQLTTSLFLANVICFLANKALSLKEIRQVSTAFLLTLFTARFVLSKFRELSQK